MTYKSLFIAFGFIVTLSLVTWKVIPMNSVAPQVVDNSHLPDAYMENVTATIMNKHGKVSMVVTTPKLVHYPKHDVTDLTLPNVTLYQQSPKPWIISAKHAIARAGLDAVDYDHNVTIHHEADKTNPDTVIKTSALTVLVKDEIAKTNQLIKMIQPNIVVTAKGMRANMNTGNIKLLSSARGEYVPGS